MLQNQQLEMQLTNTRDYYEREIETKEQALRDKDDEIRALNAEVEALRGGESPSKVKRASETLRAKQSPVVIASSQSSSPVAQVESLQEQEVVGGITETYEPVADEYDKKIDGLYLKGIVSDKMLVYDDAKVRIGCIRSVSSEWRQATLKLYIGSKSQTEGVEGIKFTKDIQFMNIKNEDSQPFSVEPSD